MASFVSSRTAAIGNVSGNCIYIVALTHPVLELEFLSSSWGKKKFVFIKKIKKFLLPVLIKIYVASPHLARLFR